MQEPLETTMGGRRSRMVAIITCLYVTGLPKEFCHDEEAEVDPCYDANHNLLTIDYFISDEGDLMKMAGGQAEIRIRTFEEDRSGICTGG